MKRKERKNVKSAKVKYIKRITVLAKEQLKTKPIWVKELKNHFNAKGLYSRWPLNYHMFLDTYKIQFPELFCVQLKLLGYTAGFKDSELMIYPKVNKT